MVENSDNDKTRSHIALTKGTMVSHYRIIEKIGAGGMGEVYLAEDTELDRKVALKFLPPHLCQDEDCRKRFKREAQAAAKLDHPNIVTVHEVGEFKDRPYFAMAHVEGQSLREYSSGRELSIEQIIEFGIQVCEGLQAAHEKGITHRDIKPTNILIDSYNRARIVDFGLATVRGTGHLTKTGSTLGTIGYMSPEQVQGKEIDHRSDLFSLGVVLYELITRQNPFKRDSEAATLKAVSDDLPEPLARFKSGLPDGLQTIIEKALEKDIKTRYQHADGMLSDLTRVKRSMESRQSAVSGQPVTGRSFRFWWIAATLVVVAAVVLFLTKPWQGDTSSSRQEKIMLAVLPFENLGDPEDEYFADGITREISSRLASIPNLGVIAHASAATYKNTDKPLDQIAEELRVAYILDGSIQWDKSGDTDLVRVAPQLINTSDQTQVWASTIERALTQVFAVQADIAEQVATALNVSLLGEDRRRLQHIPTNNMEAYAYYLRGREHFQMFYWREDLELALGLFEKAVNLDTAFVSAYAELSIMHSFMYWFGWDRSDKCSNSARSAAQRALALDSNNTSAHVALGYYHYYIERDFDRALSEFEYARKINANDADILAAIGYIKRRQGEWEESYQGLTLALELDPLDLVTRTGLLETARFMRRFDIAESIARKGLNLNPDQSSNYLSLGNIYIAKDGDASRALRILDSIPSGGKETTYEEVFNRWLYTYMQRNYETALNPMLDYINYCSSAEDTAEYLFHVAETYHLLNRTAKSRIYYDSARVYIEALEARGMAPGGMLPPSLGLVYSRLGENEEAIQAARRDSVRVPLSDDAYLGAEALADLAVTYARVGELDNALDLIDTLLSIPSNVTVAKLKLDPIYDPLRDHPRFQALIEKYEEEHGT